LAECEEAVNFGWLYAAEAYAEIRERRLYVTTYGSGGREAYCDKRWEKSKRTIDRQIKAYRLYCEQEGNMGPMGPNFDERHYRELGQLNTKEYRTAAALVSVTPSAWQ
jgi:hypothetical protein